MKMIKFSFNSYWKPTPKIARKIGDLCQWTCGALSIYQISNNHPIIGISILIVGFLGKIATSFFTDTDIKVINNDDTTETN